jgi:hypothetical protein
VGGPKQIAKRRGGSMEIEQTIFFVFRQTVAPDEIKDAPDMFALDWSLRVVHRRFLVPFGPWLRPWADLKLQSNRKIKPRQISPKASI